MISKIYKRLLHTTRASLCVNFTSLLAALRKKTGYAYSNCKKALELHNNDLEKAEEWLQAQAAAEGWAKMEKVTSRPATKEGLIGVMHNDHVAAMVEVNCETEETIKCNHFQNLVSLITQSTFNFATGKALIGHDFHKIAMAKPDVDLMLGETMNIHLELVGENSSVRRAICWSVRDELNMSGYVHPPYKFDSGVLLGKYGGLVCYKSRQDVSEPSKSSLKDMGYCLAKEIVGNNPKSIGDVQKDKPSDDPDVETQLIFQQSINDPMVTVGEYLNKNGVDVIDYIRFQCGESI